MLFFLLYNHIEYICLGILPKRKDGSENILTKLQSVIEGFDNKSADKGITNKIALDVTSRLLLSMLF